MDWKSEVKRITEFIKKHTSGTNGGVIGLSGGVDSTVVAKLAVKALGYTKVVGLLLPYRDQDTADAGIVAQELGIGHYLFDISKYVKPFLHTMLFRDRLVLGNLMARVRMCLLYGMANRDGLLVLGTTNRSEMEIGYFTKHGDGAVDIEPIAHLYKGEVYELAEFLEIDQDIINKPPSAELWEGQTDEKELGLTYRELDTILQFGTKDVDDDKITRVSRLVAGAQHKLKPPPQLSPPGSRTDL